MKAGRQAARKGAMPAENEKGFFFFFSPFFVSLASSFWIWQNRDDAASQSKHGSWKTFG